MYISQHISANGSRIHLTEMAIPLKLFILLFVVGAQAAELSTKVDEQNYYNCPTPSAA